MTAPDTAPNPIPVVPHTVQVAGVGNVNIPGKPGLFRRIANTIANEPVVHLTGTLQSAITWAWTFASNGGSPNTHQEQIAGMATGLGYLVGLIARQFVTPTRKQ